MPANTYTLIEKITVGAAGASSITFTSIPQTYTDLKVVISVRDATNNNGVVKITFNGSATGYTARELVGSGAAASSDTNYTGSGTYYGTEGSSAPSNATASTFSNCEFYIPNYTSSNNKSISADSLYENNGTTAYQSLSAGLWSNSAAITSITVTQFSGNNFAQYSTAYLYGIAKEGVSPSPSSAPYATGGDSIVFDGTYWIHTFYSSGTFTPKKSLTCDYLVVAGGGGTGATLGGGGGAGGLRSTVTATGGGGSLESAIALANATAYTITVGAGGSGGTTGVSGSNSSIAGSGLTTITSTGGGAGGKYNGGSGSSGGSGGGGGAEQGITGAGGAGTANQGYAGARGTSNTAQFTGGGGGGAGAAGTSQNGTDNGGTGGAGVAVAISGSSVTYAGGGGGGGNSSGGNGGAGGGGKAGNNGGYNATAGTANTGGGAGGGGNGGTINGTSGGSGIVIIRYAA